MEARMEFKRAWAVYHGDRVLSVHESMATADRTGPYAREVIIAILHDGRVAVLGPVLPSDIRLIPAADIAAKVKRVREATGCGMYDARRALSEVDGDVDAAVERVKRVGLA
jgi:hypothetical protein